MRFSLIFIKKTVAEWGQCYYGYLQCKELISLCKKGYAIKCNIEDLAHEENYSTEQSQKLFEHRQQIDQIKIQSLARINQVIQKANCIFFVYHSLSKKLVFTFLQFKLHQLNLRLNFYNSCKDYIQQTQPQLTKILSNCYSESLKLQQMSRLHLQAYYKIHKKHENAYKLFGLSSPSIRTARLDRSMLSFKTFKNRLNQIIQQKQDIVLKAKKVKFEEEFEPSPFKLSLMSYLFGLFNGYSFCVIIAAFVVLAVNLAHRSQGDRTTQRLIFSNQYRLWKSTGFVILYTFINAISYYIYQKYKINYPMIFSYQNYRKISAKRLSVSTILLLIWSCFFIFYVLDLVGIYQVARVSSNTDKPITIFFPSIIFAVFCIAILIQFIRSKRGVLFFLISSVKMLISMLCCEQIVFGVVWATQQLISLVQLIFDFSFSFCYYAQVLQTPAVEDNPCMRLKIIPQCIAIFAFCIRIFQSIKIAVGNQQFLWTRQMYRFLRSFLYIILASISIAANPQNQAILWIWFALGIVSGFYSFAIDVFLDWGQYIYYPQINQIKKRQYNIYSKFQIYLMIGFNLIARFFFVITICPCIIFAYVPNPELLISIAGLVQVCRRLVWNLMRIQNQQLKNNYYFKIKTDYQRLQKKVLAEALKRKGDLKYEDSLNRERKEKQLQILREFVRQKYEMYNKVIQFCQESNSILDSIQVDAEKKINLFVDQDQE